MSKAVSQIDQAYPTKLVETSKLEKSPLNARTTVSKDGLSELKSSILAHGLMQNLVVTEAGNGKYHVIAGARRLEAMQALQKEGKLPKDHAVQCQVVSKENALERSLAENIVRVAMHPADQYETWAKLAEQGLTPEQTATRFGVPEKLVRQRLALGRVAPELLKEYRDGKIKLESLMAFTVTDDQKRQVKVYRSLQGWQKDNPHQIRDALTEKMVEASSGVAKFVGLDAYTAAGGKTRKDLFEDDVYLEDPKLLQKLVDDKVKTTSTRLEKEGWGWIEFSPEWDYQFTAGCGRINTNRNGKYDAEQMKHAGCYLTISQEGKLRIDKALVKPEHKRLLAKAKPGETLAKPVAKSKDHISDTLRRDLRLFRLGAAQQEMLKHPAIAYDLLVFHAASSLCTDSGGCDNIGVRFQPHEYRYAGDEQRTAAEVRTKARLKALPLDWTKEKTEAEQFDAFRKLSSADKAKLLAACVAASLEPNLCGDYNSDPGAYDVALSLTGGNAAAYWRPTKDNYLSRISRELLLAIGQEIFGETWSKQRTNAKKGELVDQLHRAFSDPAKFGLKPELVEKLKNWLPTGVSFALPAPKKAAKAKSAA